MMTKEKDIWKIISVIIACCAVVLTTISFFPWENIKITAEDINISDQNYCPSDNYGYEVDGYYTIIFYFDIHNYGKRTAIIGRVDLNFYNKSGNVISSSLINENLVNHQNQILYCIDFIDSDYSPRLKVRQDFPVSAKAKCVSNAAQNENTIEKIEVRVHSVSSSRDISKFIDLVYPSNSTSPVQ